MIEVPFVLRLISSTGMDIGRDSLSPVTDDYQAPFPFSGVIRKVVVDLVQNRPPGEAREEEQVRLRAEMTRQ